MRPRERWSSRSTELRELAIYGLHARLNQAVEEFYTNTGILLPVPEFFSDVLEHYNRRSHVGNLSGSLLWRLELQYYAHPTFREGTWNDFALSITDYAEAQVLAEAQWLATLFRKEPQPPRLALDSWAGGEPILEVTRWVEWSYSPRR